MGKKKPHAQHRNVLNAPQPNTGSPQEPLIGLGQYLPPSYPPPRELSLADVRDRAEMAVLRAITDLMVWNPGGDAERNARLNALIGALCAVRP